MRWQRWQGWPPPPPPKATTAWLGADSHNWNKMFSVTVTRCPCCSLGLLLQTFHQRIDWKESGEQTTHTRPTQGVNALTERPSQDENENISGDSHVPPPVTCSYDPPLFLASSPRFTMCCYQVWTKERFVHPAPELMDIIVDLLTSDMGLRL